MTAIVERFRSALAAVFSSSQRVAAYMLLACVLLALFIFVPVWTTPGNDFFFQLSITPPRTVVLLVVLSLGNALVILMQWHIRQTHAASLRTRDVAAGGGLLVTSILATVACASCFSSLLSLFGLGGVLFFGEHQFLVAVLALSLMFSALWYTSGRVSGLCTRCVA